MLCNEKEATSPRLVSLDVLRGLTILLMLLVNNMMLDEQTPPILTHAPWNGGVYLADFVFPLFLFCVGVAIPCSWRSFERREEKKWRFYLKAFQRAAILFVLGCVIMSSISCQIVISLGVLQLIGLAYFVGVMVYLLPPVHRMGLALFLLIAYWAVIKFVPAPDIGIGVFEEGRNILAHINRTYLAPINLAGLPSVIPTSALVVLGTLIGDLMINKDKSPSFKLKALVITGAISCLVGSLWNMSLSYNKTHWTPSYIVLMAGAGMLLLALFYYLIDIRGFRKWAFPLVVFGSNAIFAYVVPILVKLWILQRIPIGTSDSGPLSIEKGYLSFLMLKTGVITGGWLYTLTYIFFWWVILWLLYRKKVFLKV